MLSLVLDLVGQVAVLVVLAAALCVPLELAESGARTPWRRAPAILGLLLVNTLVAGLLVATFGLDPDAAPDWPRFALGLLLAEITTYALHRAMHAHPLLWRLHRVHHEPGRLSWLDAWRIHPLDALFHMIAATAPALALGVPLAAHAPALLLRRLYTSILHADVPWRTSRLDRVLATPGFHHRHHDPGAPPANFAGTLALLDVLFGTWRPRA